MFVLLQKSEETFRRFLHAGKCCENAVVKDFTAKTNYTVNYTLIISEHISLLFSFFSVLHFLVCCFRAVD